MKNVREPGRCTAALAHLIIQQQDSAGLCLFDIRAPDRPSPQICIDTPGSATRVTVHEQRAYVVDSRAEQRNYSGYQPSELLPAGCIYGLLAAGCWLATAIDHRYGRLLVRAGMVIGTAP